MANATQSNSARVREYILENPKADAPSVIDTMAAEGIEISRDLVYNVKSDLRKKGLLKGGKKGASKKKTAKKSAKKTGAKKSAAKKSSAKKSAPATATTATSAPAASSAKGAPETQALFEAKKLVDSLGGFAQARKAIDTLEKLRV